MLLYQVRSGAIVYHDSKHYLLTENWDALLNHEPLFDYLADQVEHLAADSSLAQRFEREIQAPIGSQEVWAAGVTYFRSREARMEESKKSGASSVYDLVYEAERPELFFKSTAARVAGPGETVHIRRDSAWNVPEPELTLFINRRGSIQGYTIGNDMSSRSIEGENPLYLPQAKTYERSAAIGPCIFISPQPIVPETTIAMEIIRNGNVVYSDSVQINKMKRSHTELAGFLFRECDFLNGCFLMTGTCLVPPPEFTLTVGDQVTIRIDSIGVLSNIVGTKAGGTLI